MLNPSFLRLTFLPPQFPDTCDESGSPFVFICTNPQELLVKFPIKGRHKI
ncbi:Activating signal cointegrator 1 [Takifugu flavidus]|uniref:Activating signal cointegrator 1 n=1 Tax=Takifugu flavidus TaxID=433684 RepID=A0A5C6NK31_9TELE|nr:Activating signal cointegrator 1 [Takifugu flavidus]